MSEEQMVRFLSSKGADINTVHYDHDANTDGSNLLLFVLLRVKTRHRGCHSPLRRGAGINDRGGNSTLEARQARRVLDGEEERRSWQPSCVKSWLTSLNQKRISPHQDRQRFAECFSLFLLPHLDRPGTKHSRRNLGSTLSIILLRGCVRISKPSFSQPRKVPQALNIDESTLSHFSLGSDQ